MSENFERTHVPGTELSARKSETEVTSAQPDPLTRTILGALMDWGALMTGADDDQPAPSFCEHAIADVRVPRSRSPRSVVAMSLRLITLIRFSGRQALEKRSVTVRMVTHGERQIGDEGRWREDLVTFNIGQSRM